MGCIPQDGNIHVVLEYMDRGSLSDVIHGWRGMEYGEDLMAAIAFQVHAAKLSRPLLA